MCLLACSCMYLMEYLWIGKPDVVCVLQFCLNKKVEPCIFCQSFIVEEIIKINNQQIYKTLYNGSLFIFSSQNWIFQCRLFISICFIQVIWAWQLLTTNKCLTLLFRYGCYYVVSFYKPLIFLRLILFHKWFMIFSSFFQYSDWKQVIIKSSHYYFIYFFNCMRTIFCMIYSL